MTGHPIQVVRSVPGIIGRLDHIIRGFVGIHALGEKEGGDIHPLVRLGVAIGKIEGAGVPMKRRRRIHPAWFFRLKIILRRAGIEKP